MRRVAPMLFQDNRRTADPAAFAGALAREKLRNARRLNFFRLLGASLFLGLKVWLDMMGKVKYQPESTIILAIYWVVSAILFWASRRSNRVARFSGLAIPFLDMPAAFLVQSADFVNSSDPRALANFTLGILLAMLMSSALTLESWQIVVSAFIGAALEWLLQHRAGEPTIGVVGAVVLLAVGAAIGSYLQRRWLGLVRNVCQEQLRRERLGRYFSPRIAEQIEKQEEQIADGKLCEVTVLFSDIRDFTAMSEKMESAEVVALLNDYHARMVDAVFAQGGTLDKYIGDGLMAYFGAPVAQADHVERALRCALEMQMRLTEFNQERAARNLPPLRMGIGLHTGPAIIGSIGAPHRREFTAVGDTVNVASRLEQLTKRYGEAILLSAETRKRHPAVCGFKELEPAQVKGKAALIPVFAPDATAQVSGG